MSRDERTNDLDKAALEDAPITQLTELAINSLFLQETMKNDKLSHPYTLKSIIIKPYYCIHNKNIRQNIPHWDALS